MEGLLLALALHAGIQQTDVSKDDGEPSGFGPRLELEAELRPIRWLSLAAVGAYAHYDSNGLYDTDEGRSYDDHLDDVSAGLRLEVHPHPRVFVGATLFSEWEHETTIGLVPSPQHLWIQWMAPELDAGVNVVRIGPYNVQVMATVSLSDRFGGDEQVATWSVSLGLQRVVVPWRFPAGGQVR